MRAQDLSIYRKAVRTKDGRLPPEPVLGDSVMSGRLLISGRHLWSLMSGRLLISGRRLILTASIIHTAILIDIALVASYCTTSHCLSLGELR